MSHEHTPDTDLSQFHGVFFDEAGEHLQGMEALLLGIDVESPDAEQLNAIFRAAHSIKGGAATFGFRDITELTHEMETVFDRVRKGQMALSTDLVNAFLASGDMLKSMLDARRGAAEGVAGADVEALCARLRDFLAPGRTVDAGASAPAAAPSARAAEAASAPAPCLNVLEIVFGPFDERFTSASLDSVVADLRGFGEIEELLSPEPVATARKGRGRGARTARGGASHERRFRLVTDLGESDLAETLAFMVSSDNLVVRQVGTRGGAPAPAVPHEEGFGLFAGPGGEAGKRQSDGDIAHEEGFGLFVDPATLPGASAAAPAAAPAAKVVEMKPGARAASAQAATDATSIRVSVEKVDQLINMVGELVITQAMLAQTASRSDPVLYEALFNGLAQLERNTRDLQEAAMSIRMMPMSFAFSRFPRVVRDLAAKLGKEVELHTVGEGTELDKGLIERIVDPLTHLVRNSLDHGIETPGERESAGKVRKGTITLRAYHHGGNIVIEVSDDGAGLNRERILAKARERGMKVPDDIGDQDVWQLIFEPGFSTAAVVTDVSGRGVGMDVVKRNIKELGGRVEISSSLGIGTRISIRLPLTLAILDGMSVRVGREIFIIPLTYIVESLQPQPGTISTVAGRDRVISVRGEYLPVVSLHDILGAAPGADATQPGIMVILEAEGGKTALLVDALVGQHQVVIKSLESNFRKIPGVSGATIMGDGRVALILDVAYIAGRASSRLDKAA